MKSLRMSLVLTLLLAAFTAVDSNAGVISTAPFSEIGASGLTVNWGTNYSAGTSYYIRLSTVPAPEAYFASTVSTQSFQGFTGLASNTGYYGYVSTFPGSGFELVGYGYTLAVAPSTAAFTDVGYSSAALSWQSGGNPSGTTYEYQVSVSPGFAGIAGSGSGPATTGLVSGLAEGTTYYGRVRAVNGSGVPTSYTGVSGIAVTMSHSSAPVPTSTYLSAVPVTVNVNTIFTASATLTNSVSSAPVSGKTILFSFLASTKTAVTNSSGIASVSYTAPVSSGVYNYTASFAGDGAYSASSDVDNSVTVTVAADVTAPLSKVTTPANGQISVFTNIAGTAYDAVGLAQVKVSIKRWSDSSYWSSGTWISSETWNPASGTSNWTYAGISSAALTEGTNYLAMSKAYDLASNTSNPFNSSSTFTYVAATVVTTTTYLTAGPVAASVNASFTASATLISSSPISGRTILFTFQASTQTAVTNGSGVASVSYTAPASTGVYNYTASFAGDGLYEGSSDLANTVTVSLRPTGLAAQSAAPQASSTFTATATLTDSLTATAISGKSVLFNFQGSTQIAVTNGIGVASVIYTAPGAAGSYNYTASFAGDSAYASSSDSTNTVTVGLIASSLVAQNAATQVSSTFTATATLISSSPVPGKTVLFNFEGSTQTAVTNGSGVASVIYTAPGAAGTYNYTASFAGDSSYAESSDLTNTVTVGLRPTGLAAQNAATQASSTFTATATLTDSLTATAISGKSVLFNFQGSPQTAVTNGGGVAMVVYTAPGVAGSYNYTASFAGDSAYAASGDSTNTVTNMPQLPARPSAPAGAAMGVSSITWSWAPVSAVSGYRVYLATAPSSLISTQSAAAYLQAGLSPNTTYGIVVAGVNDTGAGPVSPAGAPVSTLANEPSGAAVSAVYTTSAAFNWGLNGNPAGTIAKLLRVNTNTTFTTSTTTYTDTGLLGCTTYTFRLWNINRASIVTQYSSLGPVFTGNPAPLPPGNLSAESLSGNRIRLTWEPAPFEGVTGYTLYSDYGTGTINYGIILGGGIIPGTSYTTDVLTSSAAYKFGVRARHRCGVVEENTSVRATAASIFSLTGVRAAIKIPQSGKKVKGNSVTVMAELVTGTAAETKNILLQFKPSALGTWQNIIPKDPAIHPNPDTTSPYFIHWDVTGLATGSYDLRAIATALDDSSDQSPAAITIAVDTADADINEDDSSGKVIKEQKVNNLVTNILQAGDSSSAQVTKLEIPAGALDDSTVTVSVTNNPTLVPPAPPDAEAVGIVTEITLSNIQTELAGGQTAAVTLLFPDADNDGVVDGTNLRASQLEMYSSHNLSGPWQKDLSSTVDLVTKRVVGYTSHFSFFALFAPQAANINSAKAYPVPWRPGSGDRFDSPTGIRFDFLTDKTEIRIYTITGQLVRELKLTAADNGSKIWDGKNSSGLKAASGVYLAHIKSGSSVKVIKIAVER